MKLTDKQIAQLVIDANWQGEDRVRAVAVALGESDGDPNCVSDVALETAIWGPSIGLWQIRSFKADKGTGRTRDEVANLLPATNAVHAHVIWSQAGGWTPWSAYKNGSYTKFLDRARIAVNEALAPVPPVTPKPPVTPPTPTPKPPRTLERYLQKKIPLMLGLDVADCQKIVGTFADGVYGPLTATRVATYQKAHNLESDGVVGPLTAAAFGWKWKEPKV